MNASPAARPTRIVAAIHGILTRQTDPSWPDRFDAWCLARDPRVRVLKKEYCAGPFRNCWVKDPRLARGLAAELELLLEASDAAGTPGPWFVAHSNGAVIALLAARRLLARGYRVGGLLLTGAACEPDLDRNGLLPWLSVGQLGCVIAYCSEDDHVLPAGPVAQGGALARIRASAWRVLTWPYGSLGRSGWLFRGAPADPNLAGPGRIRTRWFAGGHCACFAPTRRERVFELMYNDMFHPEVS